MGTVCRSSAKILHAAFAILLFVPAVVLPASLDATIGASYGNSSSESINPGAPSLFSDSSGVSYFLGLSYGSHFWNPRFLNYTAGFSTVFGNRETSRSGAPSSDQTGVFRSRAYNFNARFFQGRSLSLIFFTSHVTARDQQDFFRLAPDSNVLIPASARSRSTLNRYGLNGNWKTDLFNYFSFGYDRNTLDQEGEFYKVNQEFENGFVRFQKDTTRTRNRFDLTRFKEQFPMVSSSQSWNVSLANSLDLISNGTLNLQNSYNTSTSSSFSSLDRVGAPQPTGGIPLPESIVNSKVFSSTANWNHIPSSRYRYSLATGYITSISRPVDTRQWFSGGDIAWNILRWFSLSGGAGLNQITLDLADRDETSRILSLRGGASASGKYKRLSASFSANASEGRSRLINDEESGRFWQRTLAGTIGVQLPARHSLTGSYVNDRIGNDTSALLNYDRIRYSVELTARNIKSFEYGASYARGLFVPSAETSTLLESTVSTVSAFLSRPISRRGAVAFRFGAYKQELLEESSRGKFYLLTGSYRLTSHLNSSAELKIENIRNFVMPGVPESGEDRIQKQIFAKFDYAFGLTSLLVQLFYNRYSFEVVTLGNPVESAGKGIVISVTRKFSLI